MLSFISRFLQGEWKRKYEWERYVHGVAQERADRYFRANMNLSDDRARIIDLYFIRFASDEAKVKAFNAPGLTAEHFGPPTGARKRYTTKDVATAIRNMEKEANDGQ